MFDNLKISTASKSALDFAMKSKRLSHAIILQSSNADTCLDTAKVLAKHLVCQNDMQGCGICNACKKAESGIHPDIEIIDGYDVKTNIKVDAIRELKTKALKFPNDGERSVYIIHGAQKMNVQSQNALLKIFEEPSKHVVFILTCPAKAQLLDTIVSRATLYFLGNDIESPNDDEQTQVAKEKAIELLNCLASSNELEFLKITSAFKKDKVFFKDVVFQLTPFFRDALVLKNNSDKLMTQHKELCETLSLNFSTEKLIEFLEQTKEFEQLFDTAPNYNLFLTRFASLYYNIKLK